MDNTISALILSAEGGDRSAADALFAVLYDELHRLARRQLARKAPDLALGTTTLLHEAYLDMKAREGTVFPDRARVMGYAARVMRAVIIDHVRNRKARKRGGGFEMTALPDDLPDAAAEATRLQRLADAVDALARVDAVLAEVVDLKFFCGFSFAEIAAMRGLSERTVQRHWKKARLFLHEEMQDG